MRWMKASFVALLLLVTGAVISAQLPGPPVGVPQVNQNASLGYNFQYTFTPSSSTGAGVKINPTLNLSTITGQNDDLLSIAGSVVLPNSSATATTFSALHVGTLVCTLNSGTLTNCDNVVIDADPATGTNKNGLWVKGSELLGNAGTTAGTLLFANATSGSITLTPPTGALGTPTLTLPTFTSGGGLPVAIDCGSTGSGNQTCAPTTTTGKTMIVAGHSTLSSNAAVITLPASFSFTGTATYDCVGNDVTTRANPVQVVQTSGATFTITNTTGASDVIEWVCVGN